MGVLKLARPEASIMKNKYLFVDRDGTLIDEPITDKQVDSLDKLNFEPGVIPALLQLQSAGYILVMVTNQDGLGTASFPQKDFDVAHNKMMSILESQGITFEDVLICPHLPDDGCSCRKPSLGLVSTYLQSGKIDFERSAVVGDRDSDVALARNMGITSIKYERTKRPWPTIVRQLTSRERRARVLRKTNETSIEVRVDLDDPSEREFKTGIGFFDHMLDQIATHAGIGMAVYVDGDLHIDDHHTIEDTGIVIGEALREALVDKVGIGRFGFALPMDDCRAECLVDLSGRPYLKFEAEFDRDKVGDFSTEMVEHFFRSLADSLKANIHMSASGENVHHKVESIFKCFGRALRQAVTVSGTELPSSKGML